MAQTRPRPVPLQAFPTGFQFPSKSSRQPSILYSMLPSVVQNRLPRLPSLRRSVSMYAIPKQSMPTPETQAEYENAMVLSGSPEVTEYFSENVGRGGTVHSPMHQPQQDMTEHKTLISWKFALQGLSLLSLAATEGALLSRGENADASFARQLYVHAITYLLRGLPADLSLEEQQSVRVALPSSITAEVSGTGLLNRAGAEARQPSVLHRVLSSSIVGLFLIFQLVLPYFQMFVFFLLSYERTHRISERVIEQVGKRGSRLSSAIWQLGLGDAVVWIVDGFAGGVSEGVGEIMSMNGVRV